MRHGIPFYDDTSADSWGVSWLLGGLATVVAFFVAIFVIGWFAPLVALPFVLHSYGIFGHYFWDLEASQLNIWHRYQQLPADRRDKIGMTRREFGAMTNAQRGEVSSMISDIQQIVTNRNDGKTISPALRGRLSAVLEAEKNAWDHEKKVNKELEERGWK